MSDSFTPLWLYSMGKGRGTYRIRGCMVPRTDVNTEDKRKIAFPSLNRTFIELIFILSLTFEEDYKTLSFYSFGVI
jgi:hypothetical protein